jgi:hypothetical protein
MHGLGLQSPNIVQAPVQSVWVATEQVPSGAQHEPVGWVHGFGVHTANIVQVPMQLVSVVTAHVPSGSQQEPVGWTQGFAEQVVSVSCQMPGVGQAARVVTVHAPVGAQQAPVGISTPIPLHATVPSDAFPVSTRQVLLPAEVG